MKIAVCDDEKEIREYLAKRVTDTLAAEDIDGSVECFSDGEPLAERYSNGKADFSLILLDITMKNCDGLTAAKRIREYDPDVMIVFVSASAEYVFSGYEVRAFRYILKPELESGFAGVFRDCLRELTKSNEFHFSFQTGNQTVSLNIRDILFFESDKRKITVRCSGGREYSFYSKLDKVEEELKKHDFVRCHQSFLINAKKISSLKQGEAELISGDLIPVSKHRAKETNEAFLWALR
ncbi:MAG: response regulator transcription factor [Clostridia bacterium]|nr:response regulator transcription factor [Clostridia bacterium]